MSTEHGDIQGMIDTLEAKRTALSQAIEGLRAFLGLESGAPLPGGSGGGGGARGVRSDSFIGKTIPEATRMYLGMCNKTPQSIEKIAEALSTGGVVSEASNFTAMVQTILRRIENKTGEFYRIPSGEWALPEWYGKKPTPKAAKDKESGEENSVQEVGGKPSSQEAVKAG